jgi:glycosyltransferase involved in cell wall biosynthesis
MYAKHRIGVVIPALNEELLIRRTIDSIPEYVDKIYIIDDGSTDKTPEMIKQSLNGRTVHIRHETNMGVGAAIVTGYKAALKDGIEVVAVLAGDNQMDPAYLPRLIDPIVWNFADYTKGNRLIGEEMRRNMPVWRFFGNAMLTYITKASSGFYKTCDPQNGYSAISDRALKSMDLDDVYPRYGYCNDMLAKLNVAGLRVMDVMIPARYGEEKSKIKYGRYIVRMTCLLTKTFFWRLYTKYVVFDFHPLIFFYIGGFILTFIGTIGFLYSIYAKIFMKMPIFVNGMLSMMLFMLGVQAIAFGIIFDMREQHDPSSGYSTMNGIRSGRIKIK